VFREAISTFLAARRIRNNPILSTLHERSEALIREICQRRFEEAVVRGWAQQTFEQLLPVLSAANPVIECRKLLVNRALISCDYEVIMVGSEHDSSGFQDLPGISGRLWEHRLEIVRKHDEIRDIIRSSSIEFTLENAKDVLFAFAMQSSYAVNMANTLRIALDDYNHDLKQDWFLPMRYSLCVAADNKLRKLIGLPTSLDEDIVALAHSAFTALVTKGVRFPDAAWREHFRNQIVQGSLKLPTYAELRGERGPKIKFASDAFGRW
jgi:hypothetical protein